MKGRGPVLAASLLLAVTAVAPQTSDESDDSPLDLDVVERTERRLVQLDVSLEPRKKKDRGKLPELGPEDFELVIVGQRIPIRYADRICRSESRDAGPLPEPVPSLPPTSPEVGRSTEVPRTPPRRGTFVFYLEHKHLTMAGQQNALTMTRSLVRRLVADGARGMIVSSGRKLVQSELTSDVDELLEMLGSIQKDPRQWADFEYAESEEARFQQVVRALGRGDEDLAASLARRFQQEEMLVTDRRLRRFAAMVGALADLDPPKAMLYFADTIRKKPGEHYANLMAMGALGRADGPAGGGLALFAAQAAFDQVTREAAAQGVRLYTIQARGWTYTETTPGGLPPWATPNKVQGVPLDRIEEAQLTMADFALETGGATFKGGTDRSTLNKVYDRIHDDLSCFYLLSFYPDGLEFDRQFPVRVRFNQDSERFAELEASWEVRNRGQIVLQSERKRKESRLLAAYVASSAVDSEPGRGVLIPLTFEDGHWLARVQLMVTNPDLPRALTSGINWDLGMSHVAHDRVAQSVSANVKAGEPGIPIVLEAEWGFQPGRSRIVSVAYEHHIGQLATVDLSPAWPNPDKGPVTISPIAVVQSEDGVFLRRGRDGSEEVRYEGTLGIGEATARTDRPTTLISVVCRGRRSRGELWIDRSLVGGGERQVEMNETNETNETKTMVWDDGERCVQLRDVVPAGQMRSGGLRYELRVFDRADLAGEPLVRQTREFEAAVPQPTAEAQGPADASTLEPPLRTPGTLRLVTEADRLPDSRLARDAWEAATWYLEVSGLSTVVKDTPTRDP